MWRYLGVAVDSASLVIFIQQAIELWRLWGLHGKGLVDLGMVSGCLFLILIRMMIFHAFQRTMQIGDKIQDGAQPGKIERIHLLFSTVRMDDGKKRAVWNLETLVAPVEGKEDRLFHLQTWKFPGHIILTVMDGFCGVFSVLPQIILTIMDGGLLTTFYSAAFGFAAIGTFALSAQIGLLRRWQTRDPVKFSANAKGKAIYEGIFWTLLEEEGGFVNFKLNVTGQVKLTSEIRFGPYL